MLEELDTENNIMLTLAFLLVGWAVFYILARLLRLERYGLDIHPLYALYKSKGLNSFLERLGNWKPGLWRVVGNIGIASGVGQATFVAYILARNLYNFFFVPSQASPIMPLIPGVTISLGSLPWFLTAAGIVILTHEMSHGVQCVVERVPIKSSAILLAVVTFGGAVEPDEEAMERSRLISKMRIFASGSLTNLVLGLVLIPFFIAFGGAMPAPVAIFLQWVYFVAVNLAIMNMLPIYPLDGGQMLRSFSEAMKDRGMLVSRVATYGFFSLLAGNVVLSLMRFGLIPL